MHQGFFPDQATRCGNLNGRQACQQRILSVFAVWRPCRVSRRGPFFPDSILSPILIGEREATYLHT